ncbi:STAS domain-containing protein [Paenibacillus hemerocallicola]|jgi:anti-sigma B factor antagonist|uniref:Anti-sigma factor antagonist n=1 Tax=Paenibacillus hemerocallicola TaxID=1172614 RepID=A0A5C4T9S5_9BACL|nr:STAS domain-containing protein [Paenibacillus hemerocallicola]TNJ65803.1 STAS domain-containing protein [Paenibacillus hemerocallicola]
MNPIDKFRLRTETQEGRCTVYVSGELDLEAASQMRAVMEPLVELCDRTLTLNLHELRYIDSTGIGILISVLKARHARNGAFTVEAIPTHIKKLFDMTGITPFLNQAGPSAAQAY